MKKEFKNLFDIKAYFTTEERCREFLAQARWGNKPVCVHCGYMDKIYVIQNGKLYKCAACRKPFSVKIGTIFEDSALPLQKWFYAMFVLAGHKKGISSHQLAKDISVTQKTAWFMLHRLRYSVRTKSFLKPLTGTIEADETFIGGKEKNKHFDKRTKETQGRSLETKAAVFGIMQRQGIVSAQKVERVNSETLFPILLEQVSPDAKVITDEMSAYRKLKTHFKKHKQVDHGRKEYVRGSIHTNSIESFWALLKRGIFGIYHSVSKKHLDKYVDEFEFRFNSKHIKDVERFSMMLKSCDGRLMYKNLTAK